MRYDLTINQFTKFIYLKKLVVYDENTWRPYIHLKDLCQIVNFFVSNKNKRKIEIYNVGKSGDNYTKKIFVIKF